MSLKCYVLSLLKRHRPDCEVCNARKTSWAEIRKRLEELTPHPPNNGEQVEAANVLESKLPSISLTEKQVKKIA